ncbi:MAG: murein L,D-transpeptidase catalytic domain family protein [Ferruginibacter sp.]
MKNALLAVVILLLLAGNIYFYLKSREKPAAPKALGTAAPSLPSNTPAPAAAGFKYIAPAYEINTEMLKVKSKEQELKAYAVKNKCNSQYAFVIDMRIPSFKKRFFVYDLKKDSLLTMGHAAHGTGSETFKGELVFSNVPDSRCSSLGKYKIGASYKGIYGLSYRLTGLDSTNNKALERAIVLHGNSCVPDDETYEFPICFSYGCPMVSSNFLKKLKTYIDRQGKTPILLSIIY